MPWKEHILKECVLYAIYTNKTSFSVNLTCRWSDLCRKCVLKVIFSKEHHLDCVIFLENCFVLTGFLRKTP